MPVQKQQQQQLSDVAPQTNLFGLGVTISKAPLALEKLDLTLKEYEDLKNKSQEIRARRKSQIQSQRTEDEYRARRRRLLRYFDSLELRGKKRKSDKNRDRTHQVE